MLAVLLAAGSAMAATNIISPDKRDSPEKTAITFNTSGNATGCSYSWSQTGGPYAVIGQSGNSSRMLDITTPEVGVSGAVLTFEVKVTGSDCTNKGTYAATVNVTNVVTNNPPIAVVATPAPVNEGDPVTLDGSASYDLDKDALTYNWEQTAGPAVTLSSYTGPVTTFTAPNDAYPDGVTREFKLTVSDGSLIDTATKSVTVKWVNDPPKAVLSCPAAVNERTSLTLVGSGSTDSDDGIASYAWVQTYGGPVATLPDPATTSDITFAAPTLNSTFKTMIFGLKVTDNGGLYDNTQTCSVTVNDITPPVFSNVPANMTKEATSGAGAAATFDLPAATDAVDGVRPVTCSPVSGSTFALDATTTVTCSATDNSNNTGNAAFTVKVVDTTPPTFTAPASFTTLATSVTGAAVSYATPTAYDLVDGFFLATCAPASGSAFGFNKTTVTCGAKDAHGNIANNQTLDVTVNYGFKGLLSPYDGNKVYKIKSAVPIKWQYTAANGAVLPSSTAKPSVLIYKVSNGVDSTSAIALDDAGTSGYQYDSMTNTWQFNWKTTGLTSGSYDIYVQSGASGQKDGPFKAQLSN